MDLNANVHVVIMMQDVSVMSMSVQRIPAFMEDVRMELINLYVTASQAMVEKDVKLISTNAAQILASMAAYAQIFSTPIHVSVCRATLERIAKLTSTIAFIIHVKMEAHALILSTATLACVEFHSRAKIARLKWIHVLPIAVKIMRNAHRAQTIKTSTAHVRLGTREESVMKTSMSVNNQHHRAEMERLVKISMDLINVFVLKATKEKIAQLIPMTAPHIHAKMAELVSMESEIIPACVMMALRGNIARKISTSASRNPVKTKRLAINM